MVQTITWEEYLLEKEKEMGEKDKEKEKLKAQEMGNIDLWAVFKQKKREKEMAEGEKRKLKEEEKDQEKEKDTKGKEKQGGKLKRRAKVGRLGVHEAAWARAGELGREVRALLFPGRLKRKWVAYVLDYSLNVVSNSSNGKIGHVAAKQTKEVFVFGQNEPDCSSEASEILYKGDTVMQVGEVPTLPEPEEIHFLHRIHGKLSMAVIQAGQCLGDWFGKLNGNRDGICLDGYFTTKGGKLLNSQVPARELGLGPELEVVVQSRLRGGGFGGGRKGARGGGANSVQAGDWTCSNCSQPGCWNARYSCYRCGAPRYSDQGGGGQSTGAAQGMGGRYQGGVGSGMGGIRIIGPMGRTRPTPRVVIPPKGEPHNKEGWWGSGGWGWWRWGWRWRWRWRCCWRWR